MFELYSIELENIVHSLAISDNGHLGATSWDNCAYVFHPNGKLLNKICGKYGIYDEKYGMYDISYCCGRFGFVNLDDYVYITDENGNLIKKINVGHDYKEAITMTEDGFVACRYKCALFNFNGNKFWDLEVGHVVNGPSHYNSYWYVADKGWLKLLIVKNGSVVNEIEYNEWAYDTAVCGKYLAVSTFSYLYLYDLSDPENPKEIWKVEGFYGARQIAFSPNCWSIFVADKEGKKLKIFGINGRQTYEIDYEGDVFSVASRNGWIAVGEGNIIHIYFNPPPIHCFE